MSNALHSYGLLMLAFRPNAGIDNKRNSKMFPKHRTQTFACAATVLFYKYSRETADFIRMKMNFMFKTKTSLFEQPFGGLMGNVRTLSIARWKARGRLPIPTISLTTFCSLAFSSPAVWCRVFQFRDFQSRVFSFPVSTLTYWSAFHFADMYVC